MKPNIVVAVRQHWREAIDIALTGECRLGFVDSADEATARLGYGRTDLLLIDPTFFIDERHLADTRCALIRARTVCVFCSDLTAHAMRAVVAAVSLNPHAVLTFGEDSGPTRLSAMLQSATCEASAHAVADALGIDLSDAPHRIAQVVRRLMLRPEEFFDAEDVAREAGMSRRNLDRTLRLIGIASARRLVVAIRVLHAIDSMTRRHCTVVDAAERLGYANRVVLTRHIKVALGRTPTQVTGGLVDPAVRNAIRAFVVVPRAVRNTPGTSLAVRRTAQPYAAPCSSHQRINAGDILVR